MTQAGEALASGKGTDAAASNTTDAATANTLQGGWVSATAASAGTVVSVDVDRATASTAGDTWQWGRSTAPAASVGATDQASGIGRWAAAIAASADNVGIRCEGVCLVDPVTY